MATERLTADDDGIARAARILREGGIVAVPTETVYGLAARAHDGHAVARVFEAKGRPAFNPLIVHVADAAGAREIATFDPVADRLVAAFWPGPLTLVLPIADRSLSPLVTAGTDRVAVRLPDHPVARRLLALTGPLAAPSANRSGRISPTRAEHVLAGLDGRIDAVLDAGPCGVGLESTILGTDPPRLLRPGGIPTETLEAALGRPLMRPADDAAPVAPGMLASHYAPRATLRMDAVEARGDEFLIGFGAIRGETSLSESGDLREAAARLFETLHAADADGRPIAVAPIPETGLGRAINDRLRRAAAPRDQPSAQ